MEELEVMQMEELQLIKGGGWEFIDGVWVYTNEDEGEDEGPGPGWAFD